MILFPRITKVHILQYIFMVEFLRQQNSDYLPQRHLTHYLPPVFDMCQFWGNPYLWELEDLISGREANKIFFWMYILIGRDVGYNFSFPFLKTIPALHNDNVTSQ